MILQHVPTRTRDVVFWMMIALLDPVRVEKIASLPKAQRDEMLCKLKDARLSVRQIERLTGISKSVVAKAKTGQ